MVKPIVERTVRIADAVITGARRPQTLPTQLREVASGVVAGALYPLGYLDRGPGGRMRATAAAGATNTPVLLVHGFLANKSNWWFSSASSGPPASARSTP